MSAVDPKNDDDRQTAAQPPTDPDHRGASEPEDLPSPNEILGTLFAEASLWPLLIVVLGSTGTFGAALIVLAIGDRNPFALAALLLILGMTTDMLIRARRRTGLRNVAKLIALFWAVSIALALVAVFTGIA
jgi:uncharacterized membrane protein YjjP (DUF1212 family)